MVAVLHATCKPFFIADADRCREKKMMLHVIWILQRKMVAIHENTSSRWYILEKNGWLDTQDTGPLLAELLTTLLSTFENLLFGRFQNGFRNLHRSTYAALPCALSVE